MTLTQTIRPASALAALAILAISAVPASPAPMSAAKPNFDGAWSVLIVTEQGKCDRAYRYPVRIENGSVGYAGSASFNGVRQGRRQRRRDRDGLRAAARAPPAPAACPAPTASGTWTAGSGDCSGTWTAERRS